MEFELISTGNFDDATIYLDRTLITTFDEAVFSQMLAESSVEINVHNSKKSNKISKKFQKEFNNNFKNIHKFQKKKKSAKIKKKYSKIFCRFLSFFVIFISTLNRSDSLRLRFGLDRPRQPPILPQSLRQLSVRRWQQDVVQQRRPGPTTHRRPRELLIVSPFRTFFRTFSYPHFCKCKCWLCNSKCSKHFTARLTNITAIKLNWIESCPSFSTFSADEWHFQVIVPTVVAAACQL